jgi:membrane-associated phospholipid phosphatase
MMLVLRPRWPAAAAAAFLLLAVPALAGWGPTAALDAAVVGWFRAFGASRPGLISWVTIATDVAATLPFLAAGLLVTVLLGVRRRAREARLCGAATAVVPALWAVMHLWLVSPRPEDGFVVVTTNGFPSGHTSNATAAAWVAVLLLWPRLAGSWRWVLVSGAVLFAFLVGLSRVVLLAHTPVQVVGGWLLGSAVVPLLALVVVRSRGSGRARSGAGVDSGGGGR